LGLILVVEGPGTTLISIRKLGEPRGDPDIPLEAHRAQG